MHALDPPSSINLVVVFFTHLLPLLTAFYPRLKAQIKTI
jgi:hypothetical protein